MSSDSVSPFDPPAGLDRRDHTRRLVAGVRTTRVSGGGHLIIGGGYLACELGPVTRRFAGFSHVVHAGTTVHVFRARLIPFWFNVSCVVDDGHRAVVASKSAFELGRLVRALRRAGFETTVHRTWADAGRSVHAPR